jgi:hypothetical protein
MRTHVRAKGFVSAMSGMVRSHMTKPKTEIEQRLDRLEAAVKTMANWLVQAQTGFGVKDAQGIHRILDGDGEEQGEEGET